ncbi:MAG: zinc ABC transporter substrate-binding protein [Clostridia bacterium]|nr:zinc ABC transporter substrate-binding protein [Clostridia bacterium]
MAKKILSLVMLAILVVSALSGCGAVEDIKDKTGIVTTSFAAYDWVCEILGEENKEFDVELLSNGGDMHSYQPSAADIAKIHNCSLFVYVGGSSDEWINKLLENSEINAVSLFQLVDEDNWLMAETHKHTEEHYHKSHSHEAYDEHLWLSPKLAKKIVAGLLAEIEMLDAENSELYQKNADSYIQRLDVLIDEYQKVVDESEDKTIIFADRFPFLYLAKDYGIKYYAAFPSCSSDTDASFDVVIELAEKTKELRKDTLLVLENPAESIAEAVIKTSGCENIKTAVLDSCQEIAGKDAEKNDYIEIMTKNLASLKEALK